MILSHETASTPISAPAKAKAKNNKNNKIRTLKTAAATIIETEITMTNQHVHFRKTEPLDQPTLYFTEYVDVSCPLPKHGSHCRYLQAELQSEGNLSQITEKISGRFE